MSVSGNYRILFNGNIIALDCCIKKAIEKATELKAKGIGHVDIINIRDKNGLSVWPEKNSEEDIDLFLSLVSAAAQQKEFYNNPVVDGGVFEELTYGKVPALSKFKFVIIYGDPAILLPLIYPGRRPEKKKKYVVIDHYMKRKTTGDDRLSIRTGDYRTFLDKILEAEVVYSSSLHGIILAESYGVPSVFLRQGMEEEMLKYYDWYFATGRYEVRSATSLAEAKETEPMKLPELEELREGLLQSFPYDLWIGQKAGRRKCE